jgi:hypothetical protein
MSEHFGEKLKAHYLEYIEHEETKMPWWRDPAHRVYEGLSEVEIQQVMEVQQIERLPKIYIEVLQTMGKTSGGILGNFRKLLTVKQSMFSILEHNQRNYNGIAAPTDVFVFDETNGDEFFFFETRSTQNNPQNPPVFYYRSGGKKLHEIAPSLSNWLWEGVIDGGATLEALMDKYPPDEM